MTGGILNAKSIGKEHLNVFITERFIEKIVCLFLGSSKEVQKEPPEVFCKKAVLKKSAIFTGKHLCWSPCNFIKKGFQCRCFPFNIADISRTAFLQNTSGRLLLDVESENISQW